MKDRDLYAEEIMKSGTIVGHIPREISKTCFNHDGEINYKITENTLGSGSLGF